MRKSVVFLFICSMCFPIEAMQKNSINFESQKITDLSPTKLLASANYVSRLVIFSRKPKYGENIPKNKSLKNLLEIIGKKNLLNLTNTAIKIFLKTIRENLVIEESNFINGEKEKKQSSWINKILKVLEIGVTFFEDEGFDESITTFLIKFFELDKFDRIVDVERVTVSIKKELEIHNNLFVSSTNLIISPENVNSFVNNSVKNDSFINNSAYFSNNSFISDFSQTGPSITPEIKKLIKDVLGDYSGDEYARMLMKYYRIDIKSNKKNFGFEAFLKKIKRSAEFIGKPIETCLPCWYKEE